MTQNTIVRSVVASRKHQHRKPLSSFGVKGLKWKMPDLADVAPHEGLRVTANKSGSVLLNPAIISSNPRQLVAR